ncbi:aminotransferase class I/II-fold pyridoxal phosphate-dependent enzyme [Brevibacterium sp. HMSC07C04]|uniref:aminotransferase class I/II-fold pyridoxal phosphate-dependent enzyme n=1 Tax=Brevibacterium sp. HMSC07C04 TaxID=1581130 RepID=UPI0008A556A7|nr:aminotransferase class I/II-fold pyridoxal phosphate-dependent enzyme [Brevibacterium sp. HMSC07C04]OFS25148.1 aminotransferase class I and II [Brevibacterium sp. HMSC07C04]
MTPELSPLPEEVNRAAGLLDANGNPTETIFGVMTKFAAEHGAVNLGQGAPGIPAPERLLDAVDRAMRGGDNQYPPGQGRPDLIEAVCAQRQREYDHRIEPDQVLITVGATQGLTSAIMALLPRGGKLVTFEPFFDSYPAAVAMAGGAFATVPLLPAEGSWQPDWDAFEREVEGASIILVNSPHNPTGTVFSAEALDRIYDAAERAGAWILTDEVYEHLVFDEHEYQPFAARFPDSERIVSVSSAGKAFNITGWKIGWLIAAPRVRAACQAIQQYMTFAAGNPLQAALAQAIGEGWSFPQENRDTLQHNREIIVRALEDVPGLRVHAPQAGYFLLADFSQLTDKDATEVNDTLTRKVGVTGIPAPALCRKGSETAKRFRSFIRFSFCKSTEEVEDAAQRIRSNLDVFQNL